MNRFVGLVQLPVPDPDPASRKANVPLAAGYLKAFARKLDLPSPVDIRLLPPPLARWGGDRAVLRWLAEGRFAAVGFTCYLWNVERSLWLASRLREESPGTRILLGGPEIADERVPGRNAPRQPDDGIRLPGPADALIAGEGEIPFASALADLLAGKPLRPVYRCGAPADLRRVPNPYLTGDLPVRPDEPICLETVRGCPHRCSYCCYGKSFPRLRSFPPQVVDGVFTLARRAGAPEIYLMDPSFGSAPGLEERLRRIAALNPTRVPLHTELRLEAVTPEAARLLGEAGFVSVEAGLQSTNRQALRRVRRTWNRDRFLRGARLLQAQGIQIRTGIILGLPHDGLAELEATLDFVLDCGLAEHLEIYPLSLLPGTEIRREAGRLGIRFMELPPYWALRTDRLPEPDFFRAIRLIEQKLGIDFHPPDSPRFDHPDPGLAGFLDLRRPGAAEELASSSQPLADCLTLLVSGGQVSGGGAAELRRLGTRWRSEAPFTRFRIVIEGDPAPPLEEAQRLAGAFGIPHHYVDRLHCFQEDRQGRFSTRLFHLTADPRAVERGLEEPPYFDPVLRWSPDLLRRGRSLLEERPLLLLDSPIGEAERRELDGIYGPLGHLILAVPGGS
jgi:hypothetical protein